MASSSQIALIASSNNSTDTCSSRSELSSPISRRSASGSTDQGSAMNPIDLEEDVVTLSTSVPSAQNSPSPSPAPRIPLWPHGMDIMDLISSLVPVYPIHSNAVFKVAQEDGEPEKTFFFGMRTGEFSMAIGEDMFDLTPYLEKGAARRELERLIDEEVNTSPNLLLTSNGIPIWPVKVDIPRLLASVIPMGRFGEAEGYAEPTTLDTPEVVYFHYESTGEFVRIEDDESHDLSEQLAEAKKELAKENKKLMFPILIEDSDDEDEKEPIAKRRRVDN